MAPATENKQDRHDAQRELTPRTQPPHLDLVLDLVLVLDQRDSMVHVHVQVQVQVQVQENLRAPRTFSDLVDQDDTPS